MVGLFSLLNELVFLVARDVVWTSPDGHPAGLDLGKPPAF